MFQKELDQAKNAAYAAGDVLKELYGQVQYNTKKGYTDLVTAADIQAEKVVLGIIGRRFPLDRILTEESGDNAQTSDRVWLVDPLDGTTNFVHGLPFFAVSIGLEVEKEMVAGVVYNPILNELFDAVKGKGARLNQKPIQVSDTPSLKQALLATGFPYNIWENPKPVVALFERLLVQAQGVRRPGSAAIDLCYTAAGRFDGYWEQGLNPWDTAAGTVIVQEAGGKISTYQGAPYTPYQKTVLAANPHIHKQVLGLFKGAD